MEKKQERRNVEEKEGGQPIRNSAQTGPELEEHRIVIDETSSKVKIWFQHSVKEAEEMTQSQNLWASIPKIPEMLRGTQDFKKFYEPTVISIGPYHHDKPHLHPVQMIKPLCAKKFLSDSNQDVEVLYKKIESKIKEVRNCYDWSSTKEYDDEALARMILLDGCFLLQFIRSKVDMSNVLRKHQINFVLQDLFLLENQLPFGVLKLIFDGAKFKDGPPMEEMIQKFVTYTARPKASTSDIPLEEHSHLLHFLRSAFLGRYRKNSKQEAEERGNLPPFPHIKELKAAGIHLKPSRTSFLRDISFHSHFYCGYLNLPPIIIDDFTMSRFLNIVAYEMCPDAPNDYAFSSYICFLNELIDHADDIKELRSKRILYNFLGSDEEVAKIFNEIANDLLYPDAFEDVKAGIQKHCDHKVKAWIAQFLREHFSTPWTITAFTGAVLGLLFTGVQTYYAIPAKSRLVTMAYIIMNVGCLLSLVLSRNSIVFLNDIITGGLRNRRLDDH